jgi:hypothetical protein
MCQLAHPFREVTGEVVFRVEGVGVVLAQDAASAGQGVLVDGAGPLVVTNFVQVEGEAAGRDEGVAVVLAQDAASGCGGAVGGPGLCATGTGCCV